MRFEDPENLQFALEESRRPKYAGSWYDSDPHRLKDQLGAFLSNIQSSADGKTAGIAAGENQPVDGEVLAIVSPHAGYAFSGQAAAYAYQAVRRQEVKRIFLLGPSHHVAFQGAALPDAHYFGTPVGNLPVDQEVVSQLMHHSQFRMLPLVHKVEHSLELQLPFICETLGMLKIVPIVVGQLSNEAEIRSIAHILRHHVHKGDLVVVSSDFTHYGPRYQYQPFSGDIRDNVLRLDQQAYHHLSNQDLSGFLRFQAETGDTICGLFPLAVLIALLPDRCRTTLLKYCTSQEVRSEDRENSVSYMAIAFSGQTWSDTKESLASVQEKPSLSGADKTQLLKLSRKTLEFWVRDKLVPEPSELGIVLSSNLKALRGVFVTLHRLSDHGRPMRNVDFNEDISPGKLRESGFGCRKKELRGCIGHIWPSKPLYQSVVDNTVGACSRDFRFSSVQPDELQNIEIEISVLTPPRAIVSYREIVLGRDGILMFKDGHQSVFLPRVSTQFGWTLTETLSHLALKAGLEPDGWQSGARFNVFQTEAFDESSHGPAPEHWDRHMHG